MSHALAAERARDRPLIVALLLAVFAVNFMDRQIVAIVSEPIRHEFGLSDAQSGLLYGLAFAVVYSTAGIPIARWADRANRAHINAVENLAIFAPVVLIAHAVGVSTSVTEICAAVYFYARAAHAVVHITGFSLVMARTVLFTVAWVAFVVFAIELLRQTL